MRVFGHPVHVMVIHFPVALWPAHALLHVFSSRLPQGTAAAAGFWVLAAGTAVGWVAACFGALDLLAVAEEGDRRRLRTGLIHASINGSVLAAFTVILISECAHYPAISHGPLFLGAEFALLAAMGVGNAFGGALVWPVIGLDAPRQGRHAPPP